MSQAIVFSLQSVIVLTLILILGVSTAEGGPDYDIEKLISTAEAQLSGNSSTVFQTARQEYLSIWDQLDFQSALNTFIALESASGFGMYEARPSNVFRPGETLQLYIEPVGYTHEKITDTRGNTLYLMKISTNIIISDPQGKELGSVSDIPPFQLLSHVRNTEFNIVLTLHQSNQFPEGDYKIKYIVTDVPSNESFEIVKDVRISNTG